MTRGNTQEVRMHYKGPKTGDNYCIYITSAEVARDWVSDKTIPLVDVLDGFLVLVSHKSVPPKSRRRRNSIVAFPVDVILTTYGRQGTQGILDTASDAQMDSEFGTHKVEEVAQIILEKGKVIQNKVCPPIFPLTIFPIQLLIRL
jgi:hypothetical protein